MYRRLTSRKRKFSYALFVLTPGTLMGFYLYNVKKEMENENERLKLLKVDETESVTKKREEKDQLLFESIQALRARVDALEADHVAQRMDTQNQQESTKLPPIEEANISTTGAEKVSNVSGIGRRVERLEKSRFLRDWRSSKGTD
jgi:hypothetical protein